MAGIASLDAPYDRASGRSASKLLAPSLPWRRREHIDGVRDKPHE
jgi:hypothetical protein